MFCYYYTVQKRETKMFGYSFKLNYQEETRNQLTSLFEVSSKEAYLLIHLEENTITKTLQLQDYLRWETL